jgi:replicative DNA helicase
MTGDQSDGLPPLIKVCSRVALDRLERRARGVEKPIPTPFKQLEERLGGGWWPSLTVMAGPTGTGKTQLALQSALFAAEHEVPVLYVGLEPSGLDMVARVAGLKFHVPWSDLLLGKNPKVLTEIRPQLETYLETLPLHFEAGSTRWGYPQLFKLAEAMRTTYRGERIEDSKPFMVVLDFLQLVGPADESRREELRERIGRTAYIGAEIARKLDAAVILVSSIARDNYEKFSAPKAGAPAVDPLSLVGTGKESGEIEYAADAVIALCQGKKEPDGIPVWLALAKVRAGLPGWVPLRFKDGCWFEDEHQFEVDATAVAPGSRSPTGKAKETRPRIDARDKALL